MRYHSRIDAWLLLLYGAIVALPLLLDLLITPGSVPLRPSSVLVSGLTLGLACYFCFPCYYELEPEGLLIRCGRREQRIAYRDIVALAYSRNLAAAPALSLRRVLIRHGRWSGQLVSPRDREGFMQALQARVTQAQQAQRQTQPPSALQRQVSKDLP